MSRSAIALAAAAAVASAQGEPPSRGVVLAEARATARILPAAAVRQASGLERNGAEARQHQLSRRGNTILVEFQ
jgi:hypothetical protein